MVILIYKNKIIYQLVQTKFFTFLSIWYKVCLPEIAHIIALSYKKLKNEFKAIQKKTIILLFNNFAVHLMEFTLISGERERVRDRETESFQPKNRNWVCWHEVTKLWLLYATCVCLLALGYENMVTVCYMCLSAGTRLRKYGYCMLHVSVCWH